MRSKKLVILADESQADYDEIEQGWREEFEPDGYQEERLTGILIFNDWMLNRAQRRMMEAEAATGDDGLPTEEQQHRLELAVRYKTTLERAFYRSWEAMRGLAKDIMRERHEVYKLERDNLILRQEKKEAQEKSKVKETAPEPEKTRAEVLFQGQDHSISSFAA